MSPVNGVKEREHSFPLRSVRNLKMEVVKSRNYLPISLRKEASCGICLGAELARVRWKEKEILPIALDVLGK